MKKAAIRLLVVLPVAMTVATGAWAQVAPPAAPAAPVADDAQRAARSQVRTFESALNAAIVMGTRKFAEGAQQIVPEIFAVVDSPVVNGVPLALDGHTDYVFHIQIPEVWPLMQVMNFANRNGGVARPIGPGRVTASGVVPRDPADGVPAVNASNRADLERDYAMKLRDALKDTILDNALVLPVTAADSLVVVASGTDADGDVPHHLVLTVTGANLLDFRQGKINRDEAKRRIAEQHF